MRTIYTFVGIVLLVGILGSSYSFKLADLKKINPHGRQFGTEILPIGSNSLFSGSGVCISCHGRDFEGIASTDSQGNDVNVIDDWRASMMGNSAKDPFWQAKVSHEVAINPQHQEITETTCTKCHAPMGHFAAFHDGATNYSIAEMRADDLALDGVSCVACHQLNQNELGNSFSGNLSYETEQIAYGPYADPWTSPMISFSGYTPTFSEKIGSSELCADCHTLITSTIDLEGEFTGENFIEQATYHEWLNSRYNEMQVECQNCHMPEVGNDGIILSIGYSFTPRSPFSLHTFAGANSFMLKLLKANVDELGLTAMTDHFQDAIDATLDMLQNHTLEVDLQAISREADTATFRFELLNLAGHKFPSGYPARRTFIRFILSDEDGNALFTSGDWDADYALPDRTEPFEPHYEVINSEDQVQIYEMVFADVNGNPSTVLERAASVLKDNRLVPQGFRTDVPVYDSTQIVGNALLDPDFNWEDGEEGSGKDIVEFRISLNGYTGSVFANARVYYQSAPPEWMEEMFAVETPEIDAFKTMYYDANQPPVLIKQASAEFISTDIESLSTKDPKAYTYEGLLNLSNLNGHQLRVYDVSGRLIMERVGLWGAESIDSSNWPEIIIITLQRPGEKAFAEALFN